MVGGLVKQQHVGFGQQQAAQGHTALFTARELADHGVPGRQTQGVSGDFELVIRSVASGGNDGFELGLFGSQGIEIGVFLGIGGVHLFEALLGRLDLAHAAFHRFAHGLLRVELRLLW